MDIINQRSAIRLILSVADRTSEPAVVIPYLPSKLTVPDFREPVPVERAAPEEVGARSDYIAAFLREVCENPAARVHTLMIARRGKVIAETAAAPYSLRFPHTAFSLSKSVTGLAVGFLADEGKLTLDEPVWRIIDKKPSPLSAARQKNITVRDLLTMKSGVVFAEAGSVTEEDWRRAFLDSAVVNKGEFAYNSMNSYMLAAAVAEITGMTVTEYLTPRLFEPLGFGSLIWETCPRGIEKGGFGLYLYPEDMLKLGLLYQNGGMYGGRRIISADWIRQASSVQAKAPDSVSRYFDYGFQLWIGHDPDCVLLNGMLGQNTLAVNAEHNGFVISMCGGNSEMFHDNVFFDYVREFFSERECGGYNGDGSPLISSPAAERRLRLENGARGVVGGKKLPKRLAAPDRDVLRALRALDGTAVDLAFGHVFTAGASGAADEKRIYGPSLMPLCLAMIQNNYSRPVARVRFKCGGGGFGVIFDEENADGGVTGGASRELPVVFSGTPVYADLDFNGEKYRVAATGQLTENEYGDPVLIIRAAFAETAHVRIVKFVFTADAAANVKNRRRDITVTACFSETPGSEMIVDGLGQVLRGAKLSKYVEAVVERADRSYGDIVEYKIKATLEPAGRGLLYRAADEE